jgi:hypothetical protein
LKRCATKHGLSAPELLLKVNEQEKERKAMLAAGIVPPQARSLITTVLAFLEFTVKN